MSRYLATINTPGYSPFDDDPPVFDTPRDAWEYLADERRRHEDDMADDDGTPYSETVTELDKHARWAGSGLVCDFEAVGTVYGDTPGGAMYDLGIAYTVTELEDDDDTAGSE